MSDYCPQCVIERTRLDNQVVEARHLAAQNAKLREALASAVSAIKSGEQWHTSGCEGCAKIERVLLETQ